MKSITNIITIKNKFMKTQLKTGNVNRLGLAAVIIALGGFFLQPVNSFAQNKPAPSSKQVKPVKTNMAPKTGYAPVNGLKLYYEIHGNGEPSHPASR